MEGYYEHNRDTETFPSCWVSENNTCLPHFHSSVEITYVLGGRSISSSTAAAGRPVPVRLWWRQATRCTASLRREPRAPSCCSRRSTMCPHSAGTRRTAPLPLRVGRHGPAARAAALHAPPLHALLHGRARAAGAAHEGLPLHGARRPRGGPRPEAGRGRRGRLSRPRHPAISRPPLPLRRHAGNARGTVWLQQEPVFPPVSRLFRLRHPRVREHAPLPPRCAAAHAGVRFAHHGGHERRVREHAHLLPQLQARVRRLPQRVSEKERRPPFLRHAAQPLLPFRRHMLP